MSTFSVAPARVLWISRSGRFVVLTAALALGGGLYALARSPRAPGASLAVDAAGSRSSPLDSSRPRDPKGAERSPPGNAITMHFEDGSDLYLIAGARGRLAGLDERGGSVILEDGRARVAVAPRPGAHWVISAGPFLIATAGATLDVSFSPGSSALSVSAIDGSAVVRGPASPSGEALSAGERVEARGGGPISVQRAPSAVGLSAPEAAAL